MRSPFPGMDPWLESRWRDVHTRFMVYAADELQAQLPSDLVVQVEEGVSVDYGDDQRSIAPDVHVAEQPAETRVGIAPTAQASHVAEPLIVTADEPVTERHLEILDLSGNRVVTAIELLSPSNKMPWEGREKYLQKQGEYLAAGVNLVEIDRIRSGMFTVAAMQKNIRIRFGDAEVYPIPLRERLPTMGR